MFAKFCTDFLIKPDPVFDTRFLNYREVDSLLVSSLMDYGLDSVWVKKINTKRFIKDSIIYFKVELPPDLPIPIMIKGIGDKFNDKNIEISSKELEVNGRTIIDLFYGKKNVCRTEMVVNKSLLRKAANFGIILKQFYELNESDKEMILCIPEKFAAVLIPSPGSEKMKKKIINAEKEYVILLNDDIDEPNYKMEEDFSPFRIKAAINEIIKNFGDTKLFMIDTRSNLYTSGVFKLINQEFAKRKLPLVKTNSYYHLEEKEGRNIPAIFKDICDASKNGDNKVFLINAEDFNELTKQMEFYRNRGYKFVLPSSLNFNL